MEERGPLSSSEKPNVNKTCQWAVSLQLNVFVSRIKSLEFASSSSNIWIGTNQAGRVALRRFVLSCSSILETNEMWWVILNSSSLVLRWAPWGYFPGKFCYQCVEWFFSWCVFTESPVCFYGVPHQILILEYIFSIDVLYKMAENLILLCNWTDVDKYLLKSNLRVKAASLLLLLLSKRGSPSLKKTSFAQHSGWGLR